MSTDTPDVNETAQSVDIEDGDVNSFQNELREILEPLVYDAPYTEKGHPLAVSKALAAILAAFQASLPERRDPETYYFQGWNAAIETMEQTIKENTDERTN